MRKSARIASSEASAQTSSLLLGVALAVVVAQSAILCTNGLLSGFGWALLASLSGCFYAIISQWNKLIRTLLPERSTWIKSIFAGVLLSAGLVLLGSSMSTPHWSPIIILSLGFVSWSRALWRRVFVGDSLSQPGEKIGALLVLLSAAVFLYPELSALPHELKNQNGMSWSLTNTATELSKLPRTLAFLGALLLGGASSLQTPQQRSISSHVFWTIPTAIAALTLSLAGWLALQLTNSHSFVMGEFHSHAENKLYTLSPAALFGLLMLGLRPQLHIRNTLRMGRNATHWWQFLGLTAGIVVCLGLFSSRMLTLFDVAALVGLIAGQMIFLKWQTASVRFVPRLSAVPAPESEQPRVQSLQS